MEQRVSVAVPAPLFQSLDYLTAGHSLAPGCRVRVPLGRRKVIGIVTSAPRNVSPDGLRCRDVLECLDADPLLPAELMWLCMWTADYYHHPIGEVFAAALPAPLREGRPRRGKPRGLPVTAREPSRPTLNREQASALAGLESAAGKFSISLLEGVTGSGKTEVYLRRVEAVLDAGLQALVLTPEIGLTPQLVERFQSRFGDRVATFHSGLTERARADAWMAGRDNRAGVLIGTRSAIFVPLPALGLIVIDEEHDPSFKQQEGLRYSARDLAAVRAKKAGIPLILGSATPSLETLHNLRTGRYQGFRLQTRAAGQATLPTVRLIDVRRQPLTHGLSDDLLETAGRHLDAGGQALIFVNRRGYAPALLCHDCGWILPCAQCDARMTLHRARHRLICHHCGNQAHLPLRCESCGGASLIPIGEGTERLEDALRQRFEGLRIERVDSESMSKRGALERVLADTRAGKVRILVGTQMLAKGHDLAGISLVGVVATDQALCSGDFRATERLGQLLTQVSGRAGRGDRAGEVLVQTHQPDHPHLQQLLREGYRSVADSLLEQRRRADLPPFSHLALLRADALDAALPLAFLKRVAVMFADSGIELMGPVPAPMERRAGRTRAQLLLRSRSRQRLHQALQARVSQMVSLPGARKLRWSVDVDPVDLF